MKTEINKTAAVMNVQRFCTDDGPGIRTTVFLKGCPMSCLWCHNPESQSPRPELLYQRDKCTECGRCAVVCRSGAHRMEGAAHHFDRTLCTACGACAAVCPAGAPSLSGRMMTAEEVFTEVQRDLVYYRTSGGGVTVSGGEPLAQPAFVEALFEKCRAAGIHTAIETGGFAAPEALSRVLALCDLVLFDIKETDPRRHEQFAGVPMEPVRQNLKTVCDRGIPVILRVPVIPGLNDREEHLCAVRDLAAALPGVRGVEVMPYHMLGAYKYASLGRAYACADVEEPDKETVARWRRLAGDTTGK